MQMRRLFSFLSEFTRNTDGSYTVIVMDDAQMEQPRQYDVRPRDMAVLATGVFSVALLVVAALFALTPIKELIPGYGSAELRRSARLTNLRLVALEDSLETQQQYLAQLRHLLTGEIDSAFVQSVTTADTSPDVAQDVRPQDANQTTEDWADHEQPTLSVLSVSSPAMRPVEAGAGSRYLSSLQLPALPPVSGFPTRGFDARSGHFAVDIAVDEGTIVRSIGDGYVIVADWTQDGGYALAVQHADGFVSVYKHNRRLLKRVGDRVGNREAVAESGNTGEITTGPHLHVELWHNGLAQDPQYYLVGL